MYREMLAARKKKLADMNRPELEKSYASALSDYQKQYSTWEKSQQDRSAQIAQREQDMLWYNNPGGWLEKNGSFQKLDFSNPTGPPIEISKGDPRYDLMKGTKKPTEITAKESVAPQFRWSPDTATTKYSERLKQVDRLLPAVDRLTDLGFFSNVLKGAQRPDQSAMSPHSISVRQDRLSEEDESQRLAAQGEAEGLYEKQKAAFDKSVGDYNQAFQDYAYGERFTGNPANLERQSDKKGFYYYDPATQQKYYRGSREYGLISGLSQNTKPSLPGAPPQLQDKYNTTTTAAGQKADKLRTVLPMLYPQQQEQRRPGLPGGSFNSLLQGISPVTGAPPNIPYFGYRNPFSSQDISKINQALNFRV